MIKSAPEPAEQKPSGEREDRGSRQGQGDGRGIDRHEGEDGEDGVVGDRRRQRFAARHQLLQREVAVPAHGENKGHAGKQQRSGQSRLNQASAVFSLLLAAAMSLLNADNDLNSDHGAPAKPPIAPN